MSEQKNKANRTAIKLLSVACGMFVFGFALVPLYDVICDVTGLNGKTSGKTSGAAYLQGQAIQEQLVRDQEEPGFDDDRQVTIQFLASNNASMPWEFRPASRTLKVQPGKLNMTTFYARNIASMTITAQAVPSVTPSRAARYLHKTECFCFEQQRLASGESLDMPLRFIIDRDLPEDITTITLSYTLYDITQPVNDELAAYQGYKF
ncbi:MAG: cytochrome c oxidase assembly protein [bacterium]|nr:cytochrome c oxidase assembly protein [Gammaproteobacteria bacterium]HIL97378.1 cytochrome c oxidase assembly protein [Pseudomonadales bacterium]